MKAKSRLKTTPDKDTTVESKYFSYSQNNQRTTSPGKQQAASSKQGKKPLATSRSLIAKYLTHLPTLILSTPFLYTTYYILTKVNPDQIKHFLLPNTYLPLLISTFFASLFFFSFILLKTSRGLIISLLLTTLLFLKLQHVVFTPTLFAILIGFFMVFFSITILRKKT